MLHLYTKFLFISMVALSATVALSQTSNFGKVSLSPGFSQSSGQLTGQTGGSYSLSSIANLDQKGHACIGFADETPDHILVLEKGFPSLKVLVNTGGKDTTLVLRGPNNQTIRCGDDTGPSKDASITDSNWPAGEYQVWVGSFEPGQKWNYTLTVQE